MRVPGNSLEVHNPTITAKRKSNLTATIIPFPKMNATLTGSQFYSTEMLHLDLAADWLEEQNWYAESGAIQGSRGENSPTLVTDAPSDLVTKAFEIAHGHVCEFLVEEFSFLDAALPTLAEFASHKIESRAYGGRVGVHAFRHSINLGS